MRDLPDPFDDPQTLKDRVII